jgi:hypothetical protein
MPDTLEVLCLAVGMTETQREVARLAYLKGQVDGAMSLANEFVGTLKSKDDGAPKS